ncbi:HPP family protein [Primorskyibacter flagellatus]|uniref:CBS domain-containing membrane protein n=1 Tax=Primorskyibacter flagellatus TaxID=1387277 RepID=A0A1W1YW13_9RHOB|nr:HPP family protein [Primorskyibacter flagellatus]SMC40272.1 CBS domain-containing membrane protein [Primorskyibacter flagellatus]
MSKLSSFGPAVAGTSPLEAARAGLGAFVGLAICGLLVLSSSVDFNLGLFLVAPFGASSVLLFAVPNSPLAQPWSAIVGNSVAAVVAVAVCLIVAEPMLRIALSVGLAIAATILCRALHPPAGAVAMTVAMSPDAVDELGFMFALTPIALGTVLLVLIAIAYGRLTGRHYPFRQFDDPNTHGTSDPEPMERLGLSEEELTNLLNRYRQSFNLGVEDLARLIGAAEIQAATHRTNPMAAADIMSRNLVTVRSNTKLAEIAELFRQHRFTCLPVIGAGDYYLGVIFQMHLIDRASRETNLSRRTFRSAMRRLMDRTGDAPLTASDIMAADGPCARPSTSLAALLPLMADGEVDAVPVLEADRIIGIVTRTDLISALARSTLNAPAPSDQKTVAAQEG